MYQKRHFESALKKAIHQSKVVLVTGARQVGKSTTVRELFPQYPYITLDDENELNLALNDRTLFFRDRTYPLIIDEVQYAKELFRTIKLIVDQSPDKGQMILTGSQTYELLSATSESLAGRVSILEMPPLSMRELCRTDFDEAFLPTETYFKKREKQIVPYNNLWKKIQRGSMPEMLDSERDWEWFYRDYIRTYIERDVRRIINIKDELKFRNLLVSLAARSGQMLVYEDIARDVGIDNKTAQSWTAVIASSGLIRIVHPYQNNAIKRAIKTPKIFFMDTGLMCYLVGWNTPETAKNGAMSGSIFETFVVSEILKSWINRGYTADNIYYYRDKDKREIDLIIEDGDVLYPVEIKKNASPDKSWVRHLRILENIPRKEVAPGTVLCQVDHKIPIIENSIALPVEYI